MPGYINKLCTRYNHNMPERPQHRLYQEAPKMFVAAAQDVIPDDITAKIDKQQVKAIQQVAGGVLYYERTVDLTINNHTRPTLRK